MKTDEPEKKLIQEEFICGVGLEALLYQITGPNIKRNWTASKSKT